MPESMRSLTPRRVIWLSILVVGQSTGCTMFSARDGSLSDYEQARVGVDNPVDVDGSGYGNGLFRPEGVSAEKDSSKLDIAQRIGLVPKRRRNLDDAKKLYELGNQKFEEAKQVEGKQRVASFREAAETFKDAAKEWQSSDLEQEALLMAAESHFFAEDYYQAEEFYARLVKEYPRNPYLDHIDGRRFEIADFWLKTESVNPKPFVVVNFTDPRYPWNDTGNHGKRVLERMRLDNPTGKVSDDATMRLAVEQFESQDYEGAADTFSDLRLTYPDSEHQFDAQFLELQSLLASYQGTDYSVVPLENAEKRVKQIVKIFPEQAAERKDELKEAFAKIRFLLAERVWGKAEARRRRSENDSARYLYQQIIEQYSDTPFGEQSQKRLAELVDAPDSPPQRFNWLVQALGADDETRPWKQKE